MFIVPSSKINKDDPFTSTFHYSHGNVVFIVIENCATYGGTICVCLNPLSFCKRKKIHMKNTKSENNYQIINFITNYANMYIVQSIQLVRLTKSSTNDVISQIHWYK